MATVFQNNRPPQIQGRLLPIVDLAPDLDPITPGAMLDCENIFPTDKGWRTYPSLVKHTDPLGSSVKGAWAGLQGPTPILVAGTFEQLWVLQNDNSWSSQLLAPTPITGRWRFDMYGNDLIAVNGINPAYVLELAGEPFHPLGGGPPIASIVQATDYSVFLIEPNSNRWWSTLSDIIWTPAIATETVTGTLDSSPGIITAAHKLRAGIAMYKRKAIHFGYFTQPPFFWDFRKVSDEVGAPSQEAVANLGDIHYWPGPDDFYSFDGYSLNRVPNHLKEWFFEHLDQLFDYNIAARWDQQKNLIFWHFPSLAAEPPGSLDKWICLNIRNGKWSKGSEMIDMPVFSAIQQGTVTYDSFTELYPLYSSVDALVYGEIVSKAYDVSGVFRRDHALHFYIGEPGASSFTTNAFGDRYSMYQVSRLGPQYTIHPKKGARVTGLVEYIPGLNGRDNYAARFTKEISRDGFFNFLSTARLQKFKVDHDSEIEVTGWHAMIDQVGER